jgi:polar amino acid transport system substrate-binding protein
MKPFILIVIFSYLFIPARCVQGKILTVSYLERPPYYFTAEGRATGFLIELSRKIFQDAGIKAYFMAMPPERIMTEIREPNRFHCSVGWFKNLEREEFAKFSLPIYQNKPLEVLTTKKLSPLFDKHSALKDILSDPSLIMGTLSAFSYGTDVDWSIRKFRPKTHELKTEQMGLIKLLLIGRISYILSSPEENETLIRSAKADPKDFVSIKVPDIPLGNKRYLMFNKSVPDDIIDKINWSIQRIVNSQR